MICMIGLVLWADPLWAQVHWYAGGAFRSAPRIRSERGQLALVTTVDREVSVGLSKPLKSGSNAGWGFLSSMQFRSPFYEIDAALPYFPMKKPIPTYRIETIQVNPFLCFA
ncbi:MAG: hypothetical protein FJX92_04885 [Bacteroidetes bacterium]|nr:hypothetical protein [Bacteroidota bacterium]